MPSRLAISDRHASRCSPVPYAKAVAEISANRPAIYGVFPAVGAADLRTDRVARLVLIDAVPPDDGDTLAELFLTPQRRDHLRQTSVDGLMPVPARRDLAGPAGLTGVSEQDRTRLHQPTAGFRAGGPHRPSSVAAPANPPRVQESRHRIGSGRGFRR
ncbi:hypothetical protein ACIRRA_39680 [Nocardia sp. NPDC101769]|uniref:hypothetical protein n=1 Tax=Nocardia sp. NPDC101769 TaxID=3364333 RepID=UPI00381DA8EF